MNVSVSSWYGRYARAMKDPAYAAAKARFARFDRRENLVALVTMPALTLLAFVALTFAARLRYESLPPAEYTFVADYSDWLLPACVIGMLLTALALEVRRHLVLKSLAAERDALDFRLISPNLTRARGLTWVSGVFMLVIIPLFLVANLNNYALFRMDTIVIRPFGSLHGVQHRYEDVSSVSWVELVQGRRRSQPVSHPHVFVLFRDGSSWSGASVPHRDSGRDARLAEFLAGRTGLVVRRIHGVDPSPERVHGDLR
jgi:hypothetical protein